MDQIITDALPSGERQRYVPIVRVPPCAKVVYPILSRRLLRVPTHWCQELGDHGEQIPHTLPEARCYGCQQGKSTRVNGYLGTWLGKVSRLALLELSAEAVRLCPELWEDDSLDLWGREISVFRDGKCHNSPVRCQLGGNFPNMPDHRVTVDEIAALTRLWGARPLVPRVEQAVEDAHRADTRPVG
jgi:hypothetical protein